MAEKTLIQLIEAAAVRLAETSDSARLDAQILLGHALGRPRTWVLAHGNDPAPPAAQDRFALLVDRRVLGEPIAYLTGRREFWSLDIGVGPGVLIPRPDTETLVQAALEFGGDEASVVDLGTGSGAIALAIASERPLWSILATEADPDALAIARNNATTLGFDGRIEFLAAARHDWFAALDGKRFDMIVSNPPYVAADDRHLRQGDVRFEPRHALVSGTDGLDDIRAIIAGAPDHLLERGWLLLEHGYDQGDAVADLLRSAAFDTVRHWKDLSGHIRVTGGRK